MVKGEEEKQDNTPIEEDPMFKDMKKESQEAQVCMYVCMCMYVCVCVCVCVCVYGTMRSCVRMYVSIYKFCMYVCMSGGGFAGNSVGDPK